ncbi:MAG TPA: hypothetical protein VMU69_14795 [Bradyrhizobium sp.]|nr:hypothetical protein [Bradyrhizobium sp.]
MIRFLFALALAVAGLSSSAHAADDYCSYGRETAVLLIDRTTQFDSVDRSVFLDALGSLIDQLGPGDRLAAFTMTGAYTDSRKLFDQCKPGCPDSSFFASLMSSCSATLARSELMGFTRSLAIILAGLLRKPEQNPQSDLFRTVAEVTHDFATGEDGAKPIRHVVMFSDLLENSDVLPERELRSMSVSRVLALLQASQIEPDVSGATVQVYGFGRDDSPRRRPLPPSQRQRVAEIWDRWFRAGGAADVEIGFR